MCGIAGFSWEDARLGRLMTDRLRHRGPDAEGLRTADGVTLGHRRLAIVDLSEAGRQPMPSEDESVWLVFNGEIYNAPQLASQLRADGHRFRGHSDSEIIVHGYERWGADCVHRFNGQFAFCILDRPRRRLFLARDRFGIKPLHYRHADGRLIFASELKAFFVHPDVPRRPNEAALYDYLAYNCYNHTAETFFEGIHALPPGHRMTFDLDSGRLDVERYYEIPLPRPVDPGTDAARAGFRDRFTDAARLRLERADVEVGTCLSGGLDSSSIVCALHAAEPERTRRLKTFSLTFPDTPRVDESNYAGEVIARTGVDAKRTTSDTSTLIDTLPRLIYAQDEPFGGPSIYGQWEVMQLAGNHRMKVLLDGQGGDELLAGYFFFYGYHFLEKAARGEWGDLLLEIGAYRRRNPGVADGLLAPVLFMAPPSVKRRLTRRWLRSPLDGDFARRMAGCGGSVPEAMYSRMPLNQALKTRFAFSLPQLLREEDRNAMAFSIETRLPFLDHRLVEYVLSLPSDYKIRRGYTKAVLREAMEGVLPDSIRRRTDKLGFGTPIVDWLRGEPMASMVRDLFASRSFRERGWLDAGGVQGLFEDLAAGRSDRYQTIWKALNIELWSRRFIDPPEVEEA